MKLALVRTLLADSEKKDPGFRTQVHEETSAYFLLGAQDERLDEEQDQLLCGSVVTSSGNWQETETCIVPTCHTPRQPLQNNHLCVLDLFSERWQSTLFQIF